MTRQLFMTPVIGADFDWTLAASDFTRAWTRGALACRHSPAPAPHGVLPSGVQFDFWAEEVLAQPPAWAKAVGRPDRKWSDAPRPMSVPTRRLTRRERLVRNARLQLEGDPHVIDGEILTRPRTRSECAEGPRPCPWISCRHHLYLDISEKGWLKLNKPHLEPHELTESCSLDVADRDGITLEALGELFNVSLEGARQIEADVILELRAKLGEESASVILDRRK